MENESKVMQEATVTEAVENEAKQPTTENRCPNCQALLGEGQTFCPECGTPLKKLCQKCGAELQNGQVFCAKCGQKTDETVVLDASQAINQFNTNMVAQQKKNKLIPVIIGGVCVAIAIVLFATGTIGGGVNFEKKFADIADESWCDIASDGSYMKLDTNPYDIDDSFERDAWNAIEDTNAELGFSEALFSKMGETRSMDGRQSDENDKYKVTWTYHPDKGLEVMYEKK